MAPRAWPDGEDEALGEGVVEEVGGVDLVEGGVPGGGAWRGSARVAVGGGEFGDAVQERRSRAVRRFWR
jgi:hypothetical protein